MSKKSDTMTIGELAKVTGVHVETIRYYQRRKLLPEPERPPGGIRRYGAVDIDRLMFVKTAKNLGFSLNEVNELLQLEDGSKCREVSVLAEHKLQDVRDKIDKLQRIERALDEVLSRCHAQKGDINCPLIETLHEGTRELETLKE